MSAEKTWGFEMLSPEGLRWEDPVDHIDFVRIGLENAQSLSKRARYHEGVKMLTDAAILQIAAETSEKDALANADQLAELLIHRSGKNWLRDIKTSFNNSQHPSQRPKSS